MLGAVLLVPLLLAATVGEETPPPPARTEIVKNEKGLVLRVDVSRAYPGGLLVASARAPKAIGPASFVLDGVRCPVYAGPGGLRALVPIALTTPAGSATLGFEIRGRRGKRRIPMEVEIAPRTFPPRSHQIPEAKKELLTRADRVRDSRLVLGALRSETAVAQHRGTLRAPVDVAPEPVFGATETYEGAQFVPMLMDGIYGDQHRGLDYSVPIDTAVLSPGAGTVALAQPLAFGGQTVVIDHGRGVVSVFFHLSRLAVAAGDHVEPKTLLGASGDSGLTVTPHLHWAVYVHGVAVDPRIFETVPLE
jgi:murein DD-endopeptidase MepM/ murein hydrolase activator NlpD